MPWLLPTFPASHSYEAKHPYSSCPLPGPLPILVVLPLPPRLSPVLLPLHHPKIHLPLSDPSATITPHFFFLPSGHQALLGSLPTILVPLVLLESLPVFTSLLVSHQKPQHCLSHLLSVPQYLGSSASPLPRHPLSSPIYPLPRWDRIS